MTETQGFVLIALALLIAAVASGATSAAVFAAIAIAVHLLERTHP